MQGKAIVLRGRPDILFPIFGDLSKLSGVGPKTEINFSRIGILKPKDLIFICPTGGTDRTLLASLSGVKSPQVVTVKVEVLSYSPGKWGGPFRVIVSDKERSFNLVFFRPRVEWIKKNLPLGGKVLVSGRIEFFDSMMQMSHPDYIFSAEEPYYLPSFEPSYPLTKGITQKIFSKALKDALKLLPRCEKLPEWISTYRLAQMKWPSFLEAIDLVHNPKSPTDLDLSRPERLRLAYDELFAHQLTLLISRLAIQKKPGIASINNGLLAKDVIKQLPFELTNSQKFCINEIVADLAKPTRMHRLLQGDVGSGKTLVALIALVTVIESGGQAVLMVPTELLAIQHYQKILPIIEKLKLQLTLLTGRDKGQVRKQKIDSIASGSTNLVIGTHSLFQKDIMFFDLRFVVIDEQHRFGVKQRFELSEKGKTTDILVMTATPIPRSLELVNYGDMEISVINEKPKNREIIETAVISEKRIPELTQRLALKLSQGAQAYWVCPLIEESEFLDVVPVEKRFNHLRTVLSGHSIAVVHGKVSEDDRNKAMQGFESGKIQLLIATTVIEVGIDIPNASIIIIESAERFGLAQLHQLRGRVGRGENKSSCTLIHSNKLTESGRARLKIIQTCQDGFEIAEKDLALRGAGDVLGVQQSGLPKFKLADVELHQDIIELAQHDAEELIREDNKLETGRGIAVQNLLCLMERDISAKILESGG